MNAIPTPRNESPDVPDEELIDGSAMVRCSARLHLGFFDLNGGLGRRFGSLGLSLDRAGDAPCRPPCGSDAGAWPGA